MDNDLINFITKRLDQETNNLVFDKSLLDKAWDQFTFIFIKL
jgi:hypothetical protein